MYRLHEVKRPDSAQTSQWSGSLNSTQTKSHGTGEGFYLFSSAQDVFNPQGELLLLLFVIIIIIMSKCINMSKFPHFLCVLLVTMTGWKKYVHKTPMQNFCSVENVKAVL